MTMTNQFIKLILQTVTLLRRKKIYQVAIESLGKDITPEDVVDDEVACAETVSVILREALGDSVHSITGTWTLEFEYFMKSSKWERVYNPQKGDVLISATGTSKYGGKIVGHVGIVVHDRFVVSNRSDNGKMDTYYTLDSWRRRYVDGLGFGMHFYRYKM